MDENLVNAELLFVSLIQLSVTESKYYWEGQKCIYVSLFRLVGTKFILGGGLKLGASRVSENGGTIACPWENFYDHAL